MLKPALLTGGSGRLGSELQQLLPELIAPSSSELDVLAPDKYLDSLRPRLIVHAAAYTDVAAAETEREACWELNVQGTRRMAQAAARLGARLALISTEYGLAGARAGYSAEGTPRRVRHHYARAHGRGRG